MVHPGTPSGLSVGADAPVEVPDGDADAETDMVKSGDSEDAGAAEVKEAAEVEGDEDDEDDDDEELEDVGETLEEPDNGLVPSN